MIELYTFAISHFSEKARWALDLSGLAYQEKLLLPGPHMLTTRRLAKGSSVPILVHDGKVVQGSSEILDYLGDDLSVPGFSSAVSRDSGSRLLEETFDVAFGLGVQRLVYGAVLKAGRQYVADLWSFGGPPWAKAFYRVAYPGVATVVSRMYKTTDRPAMDRAVSRFEAALDTVDARLSEQAYLDGDRPGRADITLAALLGPLRKPPEHPLVAPPIPAELKPFITQYGDRPAFAHVDKMYREHRFTGVPYHLGQGGTHVPVV